MVLQQLIVDVSVDMATTGKPLEKFDDLTCKIGCFCNHLIWNLVQIQVHTESLNCTNVCSLVISFCSWSHCHMLAWVLIELPIIKGNEDPLYDTHYARPLQQTVLLMRTILKCQALRLLMHSSHSCVHHSWQGITWVYVRFGDLSPAIASVFRNHFRIIHCRDSHRKFLEIEKNVVSCSCQNYFQI